MRALRSLEPLTGPTTGERQRMRDRILLALDADVGDSGEPSRPATSVAPADVSTEVEPSTADEDNSTPEAPEDGALTATGERTATPADALPRPRRTRPASAVTAAGEPAATPADASPRPRRTQPVSAVTAAGEPAASPADASPQPRRTRSAGARRAASPEVGSSGASRPATPRGRTRPSQPKARHRGLLAGARGRLAIASVALLALVGALTGMSVLLSRDALPGDALYGVKRTAEAASLGLTFGDESKALKHLEFASARVTEIETLARRYPTPDDAPVGGYLTALTDFDNDATAGSRQLISIATGTDGRQLQSLRDWSSQQASRLQRVATHLPSAARSRETASRVLLDRITTRADALSARMNCFQTTSGSSDDIGALPATGTCERRTPAPTSSTAPPSVPAGTDSPEPSTGVQTPSPPLPSAEPTPAVPPVPVPGATITVPLPTGRPPGSSTSSPETPPLIQLPPLLPGLPPIGIG